MLKLEVNVTEESQSQQCGAWYDPNINSSITNNFQVERKTVDTLSAIYLATSILGATLVALALDPLHTFSDISESEDSNTRSLDLLMATCKQMTNPYQIYIIPLTMWSGFEQAFFGADFTAVIIILISIYFVYYLDLYRLYLDIDSRVDFKIKNRIEACMGLWKTFLNS